MDFSTFDEALDLAIGREAAAVQFYTDLLALASFAAQKSVLEEFRAMETGHVTMLTNIRMRGRIELSATAAVDLALARRLDAEDKATAVMSFQDILVSAIKKEERAGDLYADLAAAASVPEVKEIFQRLAAEESRHRRYFEELYESEISRDN
ncbi:MAG: ferritin family protein [Spirochaetes bacterium]|nr:ferritin family protein [Spirochaetota bacterium]MBU0957044.1 ferritin family protein [Spirochaetota bacterium]